MFTLNDLLVKREKYEKERFFLEAKIAVVDEMIAEERVKPCENKEEKVEIAVEPYEVIDNVVVDESY